MSAARAMMVGGLALAACGQPDPCKDVEGTCLAVEIDSSAVERIDQLELDVLAGDIHGTTSTQPPGGGAVALPLVTAIELGGMAEGELAVGVVAAGKLGGTVLGTGAASTTVTAGSHATLSIELAPPGDCVAGGHYCGGDKLAGDASTLYQCNGGGVPIARGACAYGCIVRPTQDDVCRGGGGTCVEGGYYCGGDKVDGDPQTLYRCERGVGVAGTPCANGCVVAPPREDDYCR